MERPAELTAVAVHWPEIVREAVIGALRRPAQRQAGDLVHDCGQVERLADGSAALGESEQLLREIAGPFRTGHGVIEGGAGPRHDLFVQHGQREIAHDGGEEVVEIVGDAAREQPEGMQPLGAFELGFEASLLFQLTPDLFGLSPHLPAQDRHPEQHGARAQSQDDRGDERPAHGQEGGRVDHGDILRRTEEQLESAQLPGIVEIELADAGEFQFRAQGEAGPRDGIRRMVAHGFENRRT